MSLRKKLLILLIFFILFIGGTIALAFGHGNERFAFDNSIVAIDKVRAAEKQGIPIVLQEKDINSILGVYLGKGRSSGNITIKGINVTVSENNLAMKIPVEYKGLHLLLSAGGKSTYMQKENNIEFTPSFYKIGNLPISKKLVATLMKKNSFKGVEFADTSIRISASLIPFSIKNIAFKTTGIELTLNKTDNLAGLFRKIKPAKVTSEVTTPVVTPKTEDPNVASSTEAKPNVDTKNSLSEINNQLSAATTTLQTSKEKQVLQRIMATISAVRNNPNYNYASDLNQVTAIYTTLTKEERTRVKTAIISNVDMNTAEKLKNTFGI